METMLTWLVGLILTVAPMNQPSYYPEAKETTAEREARYNAIARDLLAVTFDPSEAPLFQGPSGRMKTADLLLAVASYESWFRKDVDYGLGSHARGDNGKSWCLMQVNLGAPNKSGKSPTRIVLKSDGTYDWAYDGKTGYGGEDLVADRKLCFKAALHIARVSFRACGNSPLEHKLAVYAGGNCEAGSVKASTIRVTRALTWFKKSPPPMDDAAFLSVLKPANDNSQVFPTSTLTLTGSY